jgi:hypothetical protein
MNRYQNDLAEIVRICAQDDEPFPIEEIESLQELVDKATPEAPNVEHSWWRSPDGVSVLTFFKYKCPCCGRRVTDIDNFCPNCGQAIDWSEE